MNGTSSSQTIPQFPAAASLPDADLWEHYRALGLSPAQATEHVLRRTKGRQAIADNPLPTPQSTSPETAALLGATRTATSGTADELIGALNAMSGGYRQPPGRLQFDPALYAQSRDQIRELQSQAVVEHPLMTLASGAVGAYANPLNYLLGPATKAMGVVRQGATYGATLGAAQGAGEGTSALDRGIGALRDAAIGLAAGAALGGASGIATKLWRSLLGRSPTPKVSEAQVRTQLAKLGFKPDDVEQAVSIWRQGGLLPGGAPKRLPTPPPPAPPTVRPGETVIPAAPKPVEPLDVPTFMRRGTGRGLPIQRGGQGGNPLPDIGRGKTLPYYPRGGQVEQAFGVPPATSPPVGSNLIPQQLNLLRQFLQGATPADLGGRLDALRGLGIPLPADAETQLLQLLIGGR